MKTMKLRIVKATVNDVESLIVMTVDGAGNKIDMTIAEVDGDGQVELLIHDNQCVTSKDENNYKVLNEEWGEQWGE